MEEIPTLQATTRQQLGRGQMTELRKKSQVPAVVYGKGLETTSLTIDAHTLEKMYVQAGESSLINLVIDEKPPVKVIINSVQRDPLGNQLSHIDFHQVNMNEKIKAEVELLFTGEAPAVKALGGVLVKNITHVEVECLPADLPHNLTVDISALKTFDDNIRIQDLKVDSGVQILHEAEDPVVSVIEPRSEAELKALNEEVVVDVNAVEAAQPKEKSESEEEPAAGKDKAKA